MRVFVAGATGTLGVPVLRELGTRGHEVVGMTRSESKRGMVEELGATAMVADALDEGAVTAAMRDAQPEAVLHLLTALPKNGPLRRGHLRSTDEIREHGTRNLLAAAAAAGARRFVGESFFGVYALAHGNGPYTEGDELGSPREDDALTPTWHALLSLERQILDASIEGIVLRYAAFHGPGAPSSTYMLKNVRRRTLPLLGDGGSLLSWIDVEDAARATVDAMERGAPGSIYNVGDEQPVVFRDYVQELARLCGAKAPFAVPRGLARLISPYGTSSMSEQHLPISSEKAKRELGWRPQRPTYREALAALVSAAG